MLNEKCSGGNLNGYFGEAALEYSNFLDYSGDGSGFSYFPRRCSINITQYESATPFPRTVSVLTIDDLFHEKSNNFICIGDNTIGNSAMTTVRLILDGIIDTSLHDMISFIFRFSLFLSRPSCYSFSVH